MHIRLKMGGSGMLLACFVWCKYRILNEFQMIIFGITKGKWVALASFETNHVGFRRSLLSFCSFLRDPKQWSYSYNYFSSTNRLRKSPLFFGSLHCSSAQYSYVCSRYFCMVAESGCCYLVLFSGDASYFCGQATKCFETDNASSTERKV